MSFHDSSLIHLTHSGQELHLTLGDITVEEQQTTAVVVIEGIETITDNGVGIGTMTALTEDGEVMQLSSNGHNVTFIVVWHGYQPRTHAIHVYEMFGQMLTMAVTLGTN